MKPSIAFDVLRGAIQRRKPVLLTGKPGVGKTAIITEAARACDADIMVSHPVVADPTDFRGLPWPDAAVRQARFLPYGELRRAVEAKQSLVWLLDDLGQAAPSVQAACMQLLLARRIDGCAVSDHVTILAASNRRTDRAGVTGMLEPVKSRFASIIEIEAEIGDWCAWALANDIPTHMVAFLRYRPDLLSAFVPTADFTQSPSPRTWANAAEVESWKLPREAESEALAGAVGPGAATEYLAFRAMAASLVTADQIMLDPHNAALPGTPAELYATATALAAKVNAANFERAMVYCGRLHDGAKGEYAVLCIRDAIRRDAKIQQSRAFIAAMSGPMGNLISGGAQ